MHIYSYSNSQSSPSFYAFNNSYVLGILASIKFKETNVDHLRHGILNARDVKAHRQARGDDTSIPSALVDPQAQDTSNYDNESEDTIAAESAETKTIQDSSKNDDKKLSNNLKSQSLDVDDEGDDSPLAIMPLLLSMGSPLISAIRRTSSMIL